MRGGGHYSGINDYRTEFQNGKTAIFAVENSIHPEHVGNHSYRSATIGSTLAA